MSVNMHALAHAAANAVVAHGPHGAVAVVEVIEAKHKDFGDLPALQPAKNPATAVQKVGKAILGVATIGAELTNTGVAVLSDALLAALPPMPSFPAARLGSFYLGIPHAHMHPPSLLPVSPMPVPLPTMGAIAIGTCLQVTVGGVPAARAGDLGLAPTCGGFAPFFTVFTGSSKVFIGGTRAARQTDMCTACTSSTAGAARGFAKAMQSASKAVALAGIASSAIDAEQASNAADAATTQAAAQEQAALMAANALNAAAAAAALVADSVATATSVLMGTDPAVPPGMFGFVMAGAPNVLVAGLPMPNIPDPAQWLLQKLHAKCSKKWPALQGKRVGGGGGCGT
jgi:uncharacterized Zn-binding protein involved in type VI secretion